MHRVASKFVTKLLSSEQKELRLAVAQDLLDTINTKPEFLNTIITGCDPETKAQSSQWKCPEFPREKSQRGEKHNQGDVNRVRLEFRRGMRHTFHHKYLNK